jgi:alkaline phosphatase D
MSSDSQVTRRDVASAGVATPGAGLLPAGAAAQSAPAIVASDGERPLAAQGLQSGDPSDGAILVWSRGDRPARMTVEWSIDDRFRDANQTVAPTLWKRATTRCIRT